MTFAKATRPRRDRSDEFASFTPRPRGVHGDKGCLRQLNMSELDLLDVTIGELAT